MALLIAALRPIPGAVVREFRSLTLHGPSAREPLKAALSVLLAVAAATWLQLDDLWWAAFSGYMVMRGDVAESIQRGLTRIAGTVSGASIGLLLAPTIADNPLLLIVCLFAVSWIGTFGALSSKYSYAWVFFGLTAGLIMTEALSSPSEVLHFAGTRVAEVMVGTASCIVVASLFASPGAHSGIGPVNVGPTTANGSASHDIWREEWLREHWPQVVHSTRGALAVALLPLVWRWFEIEDFAQTAVTSYAIMIVPLAVVRERLRQTIFERMAHRTLGCFLGGAAAIACLGVLGGELLPEALILCAGVWIGYHIQTGREGIGYLGTQFTLGLLTTLVQGPGPITSIVPGLERLLGIVIGLAMSCLLILLWPLPDDN